MFDHTHVSEPHIIRQWDCRKSRWQKTILASETRWRKAADFYCWEPDILSMGLSVNCCNL